MRKLSDYLTAAVLCLSSGSLNAAGVNSVECNGEGVPLAFSAKIAEAKTTRPGIGEERYIGDFRRVTIRWDLPYKLIVWRGISLNLPHRQIMALFTRKQDVEVAVCAAHESKATALSNRLVYTGIISLEDGETVGQCCEVEIDPAQYMVETHWGGTMPGVSGHGEHLKYNMKFEDERHLSGSTSCRQYRAEITRDKLKLQITNVFLVDKDCHTLNELYGIKPSADQLRKLSDEDDGFFEKLLEVRTWRVEIVDDAAKLVLLDQQGQMLLEFH